MYPIRSKTSVHYHLPLSKLTAINSLMLILQAVFPRNIWLNVTIHRDLFFLSFNLFHFYGCPHWRVFRLLIIFHFYRHILINDYEFREGIGGNIFYNPFICSTILWSIYYLLFIISVFMVMRLRHREDINVNKVTWPENGKFRQSGSGIHAFFQQPAQHPSYTTDSLRDAGYVSFL